jgi:hypothetical protein
MHRRPALQSALLWTFWNAVAGTVLRHRARRRYQLLRYEDFVAAPAPTVAALLARVGVPPRGSEHAATPLPADATVLHPTHTVAGNPGRMRQGPVRVVADDEWVHGLSRRDWLVVTLLTWPLLVRYRYPLRRPRRRGAGGGEEV